jgi:hypothetical protein
MPGHWRSVAELNIVVIDDDAQASATVARVIELELSGFALFDVIDGYVRLDPDRSASIDKTLANIGGAGKWDLTRLAPDGRLCRCGRRGSVDAYADAAGIMTSLRGLPAEPSPWGRP